MKSILYVGAALMIGASIYGFIDYKKTSHKEEFTAMYDEKKFVTPATEPEKKTETTVVAEKKEVKKIAANKQVKKTVSKKHEIKPISDEEILGTTEMKEIDIASVDSKIAENREPVKTVKKKKKITREIFSRAPIREYEPEEVKKELKSTKKDLKSIQ